MPKVRDLRPPELDTVYNEEVIHRIYIRHKETGLSVRGRGPNKYSLECKLIEKLSEKLDAHEKTQEVLGI